MQTRIPSMHRMRNKIPARAKQAGWWNVIVPIVTSAIGAIAGKKGADDTNAANASMNEATREWNSAEAAKNREWQMNMTANAQQFAQNMADSSYQRAVGDLNKAGLNPMLAYSQGGAPSPSIPAPSGSMATSPAPIPAVNKMAMAISTAQQVQQTANLEKMGANIDADTKLKDAQAQRESNSAIQTEETTFRMKNYDIPKIQAEIKQLQASTDNTRMQSILVDAQTELTRVQQGVANQTIDKVKAETALTKVNELLRKYEINEAKAISDKFGGEFGHDVSPFLRDVLGILRALTRSGR